MIRRSSLFQTAPALILGVLAAALGSKASLAQEPPKAEDIVCNLDPTCRTSAVRGILPGQPRGFAPFQTRGVKIEKERREEPRPSVNLYVNFAYNSAELAADARITLDQLGIALKNPRLAGYTFLIAGHTDSRGPDEYNQRLSERRADAVRLYLKERFDIDETRYKVVGYGESRLLDPRRPEDGVNRRVQVINTGPEISDVNR
jgi:outer membrane protein OmpA-like peptidoglycan-associated protein